MQSVKKIKLYIASRIRILCIYSWGSLLAERNLLIDPSNLMQFMLP